MLNFSHHINQLAAKFPDNHGGLGIDKYLAVMPGNQTVQSTDRHIDHINITNALQRNFTIRAYGS